MDLRQWIRDVPDFPKKGIVFKDITPLLADAQAFKEAMNELKAKANGKKFDKIASIESRGFIFGAALAAELNKGFVPLRKKGRLPWKTKQAEYALEYGTDVIEAHEDAFKQGEKVLIIDDLVATGGSAKAACELIEGMNVEVVGLVFLISLDFLNWRKKLGGYDVQTIISYDKE